MGVLILTFPVVFVQSAHNKNVNLIQDAYFVRCWGTFFINTPSLIYLREILSHPALFLDLALQN